MNFKNNIKKFIYYLSKKKFFIRLLGINDKNIVFLNYHRVLSDEDFKKKNRPDDDLVVSLTNFEKQIKFLSENFNVISINDIESDNFNKKSRVIITFDDGYFDNFNNAFLILKKYKCPAIIYISTAFLDDKNYPWWLKIWNIIFNNNELVIEGEKHDLSKKELKYKTYKSLSKKIILLNKNDQKIFFDMIQKNNKLEIKHEKNIFLNKNDLKTLSQDQLIEIGCHTHFHQNLKILDYIELEEEIIKSKKILEEIINKKVNHFSIPFGTKDTFSKKILSKIKDHEFKTIVNTRHDLFNIKKLSEIPRIGIGNNDLGNRLYSKAIGLDSFLNKLLGR